ncbi:MAG: hypothetical protein FJY97_12370 [candidate division Zixibacteria bacterium]|nr:hypothetical protein [candidate division Zixibacteria bacterium]
MTPLPVIPQRLAVACRQTPERSAWLDRLPDALRTLQHRWQLTLDASFDDDDVSCAYVAPGRRADGTPVVLKLGMPHMEAEHEIEGLRFWDGDPSARLFDADPDVNAMLLERCIPGTRLRTLPETEQDRVTTGKRTT